MTDLRGFDEFMAANPFAEGSLACGICIIIVTVVGVAANVATMIIFGRRQPLSSIQILLAGLAVADGLLLITAGPLYASVALYSYFTSIEPPISLPNILALEKVVGFLAVYLYPITSMFQSLSVWIMLIITVDRYVAVSHPFLARTACTKYRAITALILSSALSIGYNAIRFFDYDLVEEIETDETTGTAQKRLVVVHALRANHAYLSIYSHWMYFVFIFAVPFAALFLLNGLVVAVIRKAQKCRATLSRQRRTEYATATMMIMVTFIFLICNSLAFAVNAMEAFGGIAYESVKNGTDVVAGVSPVHTPLFYFLIDLSNLLVMTHCTSNFFIYLAFCKRFRQQCRTLFTAPPRKRSTCEAIPLYQKNSISISSIRWKKLQAFRKARLQCSSVV